MISQRIGKSLDDNEWFNANNNKPVAVILLISRASKSDSVKQYL